MSNVISGANETSSGFMPKITKALKYIIISYVISLILIVALSAIVCYTDVPESVSGPGVKVITFTGVFISAFLCAKSASGKGWLIGGLTGVANIVILLLLGMASMETVIFTRSNAVQLLCGFVFGAVGGIFGINLSRK